MENMAIIRDFGILYRTFLNFISKSNDSRDLAFSDGAFLMNIGENEGISQEEIASSLAIDKAAVARSVKSMESKGYIRIERSAADRRVKELYLSPSGRELFLFMQGLHGQWLEQVLADLDSDEIQSFVKTIHTISERAKSIRK